MAVDLKLLMVNSPLSRVSKSRSHSHSSGICGRLGTLGTGARTISEILALSVFDYK